MVKIRRSDERGHADHGWLQSKHTFSFANYHDPKFMGFRSLRVINEDLIAGGQGFGAHPHKDMEIISYVTAGELQHQDSMGNKTSIKPGEVQRMSAGTGVVHSEVNPLEKTQAHLFQIWILPKTRGIAPAYGQKSFAAQLDSGQFVHVVSQDGRDGSISIHQDADMYIARSAAGKKLDFNVRPSRGVWIQIIEGRLNINGQVVQSGDALAIEDESQIQCEALDKSELILFDLA